VQAANTNAPILPPLDKCLWGILRVKALGIVLLLDVATIILCLYPSE